MTKKSRILTILAGIFSVIGGVLLILSLFLLSVCLTQADGNDVVWIILIPLGILTLVFCSLGLGFFIGGRKSKRKYELLEQRGQSIEGIVTGYKKTHQTVPNSVGLKYYHRLIIEGSDGNIYYSPQEQLLILKRIYPIGSKMGIRVLLDNSAIYEVEADF